MKDHPTYPVADQVKMMGKVYQAYAVFERRRSGYFGQDIQWVHTVRATPIVGWFVGTKRIYDGKIENDIECGNSFKRGASHLAFLLLPWPTMKPIMCPTLLLTSDTPKCPYGYKWTERDKEIMRADARAMKRDELGRFQPKNKALP